MHTSLALVFKHLDFLSLLKVSQVSRLWKIAALSSPALVSLAAVYLWFSFIPNVDCSRMMTLMILQWRKVKLKGLHVKDWKGLITFLSRMGTVKLDARGLVDPHSTWNGVNSIYSHCHILGEFDELLFDAIPDTIFNEVAHHCHGLRIFETQVYR